MRVARDLVPLEDGWLQAGTVAAAAHNDFERFLAGKAGRRVVDERRLHAPRDYVPRVAESRRGVTVDQASIDAHQAALESRHRT